MNTFLLSEFLGRSTDKVFEDTTLATIVAALPPLSPSGPWLAGGALRRTLLGEEPSSDFDIFFRDADQMHGYEEGMKAIGFKVARRTKHHISMRGTVSGSSLEREVQLIHFAYYPDATAVIDSFDYTICQICFDGSSITLGDHTLWDLGRRRLAVHRITYPVASMRRMIKYAAQGFNACPGAMAELLRQTTGMENPERTFGVAYVD